MVQSTLWYGAFLVVLGLGGYILTGATTALIPAFIGIPVLGLGFAARNPAWRRNAMYVAVGLGSLGLLAALSRLIPAFASGAEVGPATMSLSFLALGSAVYVVMGIRSFIEAQRQRTA